jgi:hypothetical protein
MSDSTSNINGTSTHEYNLENDEKKLAQLLFTAKVEVLLVL